jgi:hypothetical protein
VRKLQECDRALPQIVAVREHLTKGIACHHAGLLPLVKEVTEIVFSEGLVKVLFATESASPVAPLLVRSARPVRLPLLTKQPLCRVP